MASTSTERLIRTFVFCDIEAAPKTKGNKIIEMCLIAVRRATLYHTFTKCQADAAQIHHNDDKQTKQRISGRPTYKNPGYLPRIMEKMILYFDPDINQEQQTGKMGLSSDLLKCATVTKFDKNTVDIMHQFFERQEKPICLVTHNGSRSEFKILMRELTDINEKLPDDLLCVDSLDAFIRLETRVTELNSEISSEFTQAAKKRKYVRKSDVPTASTSQVINIQVMSSMTAGTLSEIKATHPIQTTVAPFGDQLQLQEAGKPVGQPSINQVDTKKSSDKLFTEEILYKRFFHKILVRDNTETCTQALVQMVVFKCNEILPYFDQNAKLLTSVKPMQKVKQKEKNEFQSKVEQAKLVDQMSNEELMAILLKRQKP